MAAGRGDLEQTGKRMMGMSRRSRPATDGNKNVQSRARRKSSQSMGGRAMAIFRRTFAGPGP